MKISKDMMLDTERLVIRPYIKDDLIECFNLMQDKELFKYINMDVMNIDEYKGLFSWLIDSYEVGFHEDFKYSFNITLKESGKHIGWCGVGVLDFDFSKKEIFYLIGKEHWGKGYAKEAIKALVDFCFNTIGLEEIVAVCKPENIASRRIIEGAGLKFQYIVEGLDGELSFYNGEPFFSLNRDEYLRRASL